MSSSGVCQQPPEGAEADLQENQIDPPRAQGSIGPFEHRDLMSLDIDLQDVESIQTVLLQFGIDRAQLDVEDGTRIILDIGILQDPRCEIVPRPIHSIRPHTSAEAVRMERCIADVGLKSLEGLRHRLETVQFDPRKPTPDLLDGLASIRAGIEDDAA